MADVLLKLGGYSFSVTTAAFQELNRKREWRWPAQERIGTLDALQFTGRKNDTITLTGTIYPHYRDAGARQIEAMAAEADKGMPLMLVTGYGDVWGFWCIKSIDEKQPRHARKGEPLRQDFTLEIVYYGEQI